MNSGELVQRAQAGAAVFVVLQTSACPLMYPGCKGWNQPRRFAFLNVTGEAATSAGAI
jgi:hypothetical protein